MHHVLSIDIGVRRAFFEAMTVSSACVYAFGGWTALTMASIVVGWETGDLETVFEKTRLGIIFS